jgi:hypothetical protein
MSKQLIFIGTYQILPYNFEIFMAANEEMGDFVPTVMVLRPNFRAARKLN